MFIKETNEPCHIQREVCNELILAPHKKHTRLEDVFEFGNIRQV